MGEVQGSLNGRSAGNTEGEVQGTLRGEVQGSLNERSAGNTEGEVEGTLNGGSAGITEWEKCREH